MKYTNIIYTNIGVNILTGIITIVITISCYALHLSLNFEDTNENNKINKNLVRIQEI